MQEETKSEEHCSWNFNRNFFKQKLQKCLLTSREFTSDKCSKWDAKKNAQTLQR